MTLLVGLRPDKDDRSGVELAATFARSSGQDLAVVSVVPTSWPTPVAGHTDREFELWAAEQGERAVAEAEALLADHCPDVQARALWVHGRSIPGALLEQAEALDAAMIVMGSGNDGAYGHVHLGSTSDRLLHSSHVPVALATRGYYASEHGRVTRATCAFRGDDVSRRTLERTAAICVEVGAALRVATFAVRGRTMYPPETGLHNEDMVMNAWLAQTEAAQAAALAELGQEGILPQDVETVVGSGRTWASAIDQLRWERDDVLVIGSSAASFMSRLFLGSNATKLVRYSPVPVIIVP